jgi:predicted membrane channel-forming protein YqfA (hemolysin III family)
MEPSWRKPAGIFIILGMIAVLAVLVASASPWIGQLPMLLQTLIYLVVGIIWIMPLKPLLRWMELGPQNHVEKDQ